MSFKFNKKTSKGRATTTTKKQQPNTPRVPPTVPTAGGSPTKFMTKISKNVKRRGSRGIAVKKK